MSFNLSTIIVPLISQTFFERREGIPVFSSRVVSNIVGSTLLYGQDRFLEEDMPAKKKTIAKVLLVQNSDLALIGSESSFFSPPSLLDLIQESINVPRYHK